MNALELLNRQQERIFTKLANIEDDYYYETKELLNFLQARKLSFNPEGVKHWIESLKAAVKCWELKPNSYNKKLSMLSRRLRSLFAGSDSCLDSKAQDALKAYLVSLYDERYDLEENAPVKEEKLLSAEEINKLIEAAPPKFGLMFSFLAQTGVRISEALTAAYSRTRELPDRVGATVLGKGRRVREVFITPKLFRIIKETFEGTTFLFENHGHPYDRKHIGNELRKLSRAVLKRTVTPHMFRHSFISQSFTKGVGADVIARYVGHKNPVITQQVYNHHTVDWAESFENLWR